jgi:cytochrome c556
MRRLGTEKLSVKIGLLLLVGTIFTTSNPCSPADQSPASMPGGAIQPREALIAAFQTNLGYCRDWLATKDFKSLAQNVGALSILTQAVERHTAESGQDKFDSLRQAIDELSAAAKAEDGRRARTAMDALAEDISVIAASSPAEYPHDVTKTSAGFTPLMHLIDGTFTDAKAALASGDVTAAKSYAVVLVELAQWLAADRTGQQWKSQAADLGSAAQTVASSAIVDSKLLRAQFHDVYTRCAACHARQR